MNTKFFIFIYLFGVNILFSSQFKFQADGELLEYTKDNITINELTDNVQVFNDSLYLETDKAYNYKEINKLHLYGNTKMISNTDTLTCDSMIYWIDRDSLFAFGDVQLTQLNRNLNTDELLFWETNGYRGSSFFASGGVTVSDKNKMIQADVIAYDDSMQIMTLDNNAKVLSDNRKVFGDYFKINFKDSLISFINVKGNATAHNVIDAKINKESDSYQRFTDIMSGNNIDISFENDKITMIELDRMASAMYHALDSSLLMGVNIVDGDLINLSFQNDQLNKINVEGDARGSFTPEPNNSSIDSVITYKSNEINYLLDSQESFLSDNGEIQYQNMLLEANHIYVDWANNILNAVKKSDKLPTVTTSGGEPMKGDSLRYSLLDKQGTIYKGKTKIDDAYYHGNISLNWLRHWPASILSW